MQQELIPQNDPEIIAAGQILRARLVEYKALKKFGSNSDLARDLGVSQSQIQRYIHVGNTMLPTDGILVKISKKIEAFTQEEISAIGKAFSRQTSLSRALGAQRRWGTKQEKATEKPKGQSLPQPVQQRSTQTTLALTPDWQEKVGLLLKMFGPLLNSQDRNEKPVSLVDYDSHMIGGQPYILTMQNFRGIKSSDIKPGELDKFLTHTINLLQLARRSMIVIAQLPEHDQQELLARLGKEADLFLRSLKVAQSLVPMEYIKDVDLGRLAQSITTSNQQKESS